MKALTETSVAAFAERHEDADSPDDRGAEEPSLASVPRRRPGHGRALPQPRHRHGDGPGEDHAHPVAEVGRHQQVHQVPHKAWIFWFLNRVSASGLRQHFIEIDLNMLMQLQIWYVFSVHMLTPKSKSSVAHRPNGSPCKSFLQLRVQSAFHNQYCTWY